MKVMVEKPNSPPERIRRIVLWQPSVCGMPESIVFVIEWQSAFVLPVFSSNISA